MNKSGQRFQGVSKLENKSPRKPAAVPKEVPKMEFDPQLAPVIYANHMEASFGQGEVTLTFGQTSIGPNDKSLARLRLVVPHSMVPSLLQQMHFLSMTLEELYGGKIPFFQETTQEGIFSAVARVQKRLSEAAQAAQAASKTETEKGQASPTTTPTIDAQASDAEKA